ncbi:MAG: hypothetical protein ABSA93_00490 [Streptosporangiaceae bacterium]|jgi:cytoskeletal protein RodZ
MRVPQVNERVKEAPAHALRAMFASIGQLLLFTDRLRSKTADETTTEETTVPAQAAAPKTEQAEDVSTPAATSTPEASTTEAPEAAAPEAPEAVTPEAAAPEAEAAPAEAAPVAEAAAVTEAADAALAEAKAEADSKVEAVEAAELPLPNYDELTIPSLRARLRNLSIPQLNQLIGYEQAHANRSEVIAMFERRLAKLAES